MWVLGSKRPCLDEAHSRVRMFGYSYRGATEWPEPVLHAFKNIECRDAVLAYDAAGYLTETGEFCPADEIDPPKLRDVWDRRTRKTDPVNGREVPDDKAVRPIDAFQNPAPPPGSKPTTSSVTRPS